MNSDQNVYKQKKGMAWMVLHYTVIFCIMCAVAAFFFCSSGKGIIHEADSISQHFPVFQYIIHYMRDFLNGVLTNGQFVLPMVDLNIGQGMDVLTTLNYYGFGDPVNLLFLFVPDSLMAEFYVVSVLLRLYCSGLFFLLYCDYMRAERNSLMVSCAISYVFCSFGLFAVMKHSIFGCAMLYFPLVLLGIERIWREKKPGLLIASLTCSLISNFYFAYMTVIMTVLYVLLRVLREKNRSFRQCFAKLMGYAGYYLLSAGLSAVILLPVVLAFFQNGRQGDIRFQLSQYLSYSTAEYKRYLYDLAFVNQNATGWTCLGFSVLVIPALAVLIFHRSKKEEKKLLSYLRWGTSGVVLMLCVPLAGKIMNGFGYVCNRWFFVGSLLAELLVIYLIPILFHASVREKLLVTCASIAWIIFVVLNKKLIRTWQIGIMVCLGVFLILLWVPEKKEQAIGVKTSAKTKISALLMEICVVFNIICLFSPSQGNYVMQYVDWVSQMDRCSDTPAVAVKQITEEETFRIDQPSATINFSLTAQFNGHGFYYSMVPECLTEFYRSVGLNQIQFSDLVRGNGACTILDEITSTRYYADWAGEENKIPYAYKKVLEDEKYAVYENPYALPLAFCYSTYMTREEYEALPLEKRQMALIQGAVLESEEESISGTDTTDMNFSIEEYPVTALNGENAFYKKGKLKAKSEGEKLELQFDVPADRECYLVFEGVYASGEGSKFWYVESHLGRERVKVPGLKSRFEFSHHDIMVNLGYSSEKQNSCTIQFPEKMSVKVKNIKVVTYDLKDYPKQAQELQKYSLQNVRVDNNRIEGEISVPDTRLLYLSIPFSKGWSAYVDGEKTEIRKANLAYMAIPVDQGTHQIRFCYETPGIRAGAGITAVSLVILIITGIYRRRKRRGKTE